MNRQITILYFAHLVEMLGRDNEVLFLPLSVNDLHGLMAHLARRGDEWAMVFEKRPGRLKITVNKQFVDDGANVPLKGGDEVAFVAFKMS
jgi:molybdopterin converting factor small subunit